VDSKLCGCTRNFLHGVEEVVPPERDRPDQVQFTVRVMIKNVHDTQRVDRSELQFVSTDEPDDSVGYWRSRTPEERLEAIQNLRQTFYGLAASERLCRVLEFAQRA